MEKAFDITLTGRKVLQQFLENHTLEQLNKIPPGFNNNLMWNIGHIITIQQLLVYKLSNLPMMIADDFAAKYQKGTRPERDLSQDEVDEIKSLLFITIDQTQHYYINRIFETYHPFSNNLGFALRNIEDAIAFNYYHEAMHTGMMMSIRKFV